jgi:hypothetical protein
VAEATVSYAPAGGSPAGGAAAPAQLLRAVGAGEGTVLGFAKTQKRIESEFDARAFAARRWTSVRSSSGKTTVDSAEQAKAGTLSLLRKRTGEHDLAESFVRSAAVLDPLSFLLHLRMALPAAPTTYEILDGRALWLAHVSAARIDGDDPWLLRLDGKVDPIYWNGDPDKQRTSRSFVLYLKRDRFHTPARLVVPSGLGEFRAELVKLNRTDKEPTGKRKGAALCERGQRDRNWRRTLDCWSGLLTEVPRSGAAKH